MLSRPGWRRYPAGPEAGHADSDERHSVFAADRLPLALICRATAFRSARPSTISFASSSAILWEAIWAELHMALRERMGREASPSAAVLDSQSIKSAEKGAVTTTRWVTTPASR
jgi:hypothetical protein